MDRKYYNPVSSTRIQSFRYLKKNSEILGFLFFCSVSFDEKNVSRIFWGQYSYNK